VPNGGIELDTAVHAGTPPEAPLRGRAQTFLRRLAPSPEAVTPDPRQALADMRLGDDLRGEFERALQPFGIALAEAAVKDRYGPMQRRYTQAAGAGVEIVLLQIPAWVLRDGNALGSIDETRYAFRGKTVRVVCRDLDATSAGFNTLRRDWLEREQIDLKFVPWSQLLELAADQQALAQVLEVSALEQAAAGAAPPAASPGVRKVKVFVSYAHHDAKYVHEKDEPSLLAYVKGTLEREGFEFWWDRKLTAGDLWDEEIKAQLAAADIALVLVSQPFLNSKYCIEDEVKAFLEARKASGLVIFPVILSSCDWESHAWLKSTQFEPREGRTIEKDYRDRGERDELYLAILKQLRAKTTTIATKAR
jgi:hypothetical protein